MKRRFKSSSGDNVNPRHHPTRNRLLLFLLASTKQFRVGAQLLLAFLFGMAIQSNSPQRQFDTAMDTAAIYNINNTDDNGHGDLELLVHCYRESSNKDRPEAKYNLLITGCGYSSTGFFAKTFTSAGYPLGHEQMAKYGSSNWLASSRQYRNTLHTKTSPFLYKHIMLLVRHPLKVINSEYGTKWDFKFDFGHFNVGNEVMVDRKVFDNNLQIEFKTLEWWITFTLSGENLSECYIRNEDISIKLLTQICQRAELPDCLTTNWTNAIQSNTGYNTHQKKQKQSSSTSGSGSNSPPLPPTWEILEKKVSNDIERDILNHARQVCKRFGYDDC